MRHEHAMRIREAKAFSRVKAASYYGIKYGVILVGDYINARTPTTWESKTCGHRFLRAAASLKPNAVCPNCAWKRVSAMRIAQEGHTVEEFNEFARRNDVSRNPDNGGYGARCLAAAPVGVKEKVSWKCSNPQHEPFIMTPDAVINGGSWCPKCAPTKAPAPIENLYAKVAMRGGEVLEMIGGKWRGGRTNVRYRCTRGHEWGPIPAQHLLFADKWCPLCQSRSGERITRAIFEETFGDKFPECSPSWMPAPLGKQRLRLDGYNEQLKMAFEYQGPHHYENPNVQARDLEKIQACRQHDVLLIAVKGITNPFPPDNILVKVHEALLQAGVQDTPRLPPVDIFAHEMKELQSLAANNKGRLLSPYFSGNGAKYEWKCSNPDHPSWWVPPYVIRKGHWCRYCAGRGPLSIERLRDFGKSVGLVLVSAEYINADTEYTWRCIAVGHEFKRIKACIQVSARKGLAACPYCAGTNKNDMIAVVRACIKHRGWTLHDGLYLDAHTPLSFTCRFGHTLIQNWNKVQQGAGCGHRGCPDNRKYPKWRQSQLAESLDSPPG